MFLSEAKLQRQPGVIEKCWYFHVFVYKGFVLPLKWLTNNIGMNSLVFTRSKMCPCTHTTARISHPLGTQLRSGRCPWQLFRSIVSITYALEICSRCFFPREGTTSDACTRRPGTRKVLWATLVPLFPWPGGSRCHSVERSLYACRISVVVGKK